MAWFHAGRVVAVVEDEEAFRYRTMSEPPSDP